MLRSLALTVITAWALIKFWPMTGLPFWPLFTSGAALLVAWGLWVGKGAWRAPAAILAGYGAMRAVMTYAADPVQEHAAFLVWAVAAIVLIYNLKAWLPGVCYLLSGATYPVFVLFGFPIEYIGLAPIVAEMFALFALISMGGGLYDRRPLARSSALPAGNHTFLARAATGAP